MCVCRSNELTSTAGGACCYSDKENGREHVLSAEAAAIHNPPDSLNSFSLQYPSHMAGI